MQSITLAVSFLFVCTYAHAYQIYASADMNVYRSPYYTVHKESYWMSSRYSAYSHSNPAPYLLFAYDITSLPNATLQEAVLQFGNFASVIGECNIPIARCALMPYMNMTDSNASGDYATHFIRYCPKNETEFVTYNVTSRSPVSVKSYLQDAVHLGISQLQLYFGISGTESSECDITINSHTTQPDTSFITVTYIDSRLNAPATSTKAVNNVNTIDNRAASTAAKFSSLSGLIVAVAVSLLYLRKK
jgi:hypothetical protein